MLHDFKSDLIKELSRRFKRVGVKHSSLNLDDMLMDYLTILKKWIPPKRRAVKYNPELWAQLPTHPRRSEIGHLERIFKEGGNLNHFQNKKLFQTQFHDHLAYEWNIYHLHLSVVRDRKNPFFVKQVSQLLFVFVDKEEAIFLGIDNHSAGTFGDVKWLEILHDHFPYIIEPHRDESIEKIYPDINGIDRQSIWDKGYTLFGTNIRGEVYINPGLGRTTSGHSMQVSMHALDIVRWINKINKQFEVHSSQIAKSLNIGISEPEFYLKFNSTFEICERKSGSIVISYPNIFKEQSIQT